MYGRRLHTSFVFIVGIRFVMVIVGVAIHTELVGGGKDRKAESRCRNGGQCSECLVVAFEILRTV